MEKENERVIDKRIPTPIVLLNKHDEIFDMVVTI